MKHTAKLMLAIGLGAAAAILNWVVVSQRTRPVRFATLTGEVRAGETITTDRIDFVEVEASYADALRTSVVPWAERAVLSGRKAARDLQPGVLLLWDDAPIRGPRYDLREGETAVFLDLSQSPVSSIAVGESISFRFVTDESDETIEWVGPFRVVTVDEKRVPGERIDRAGEISVAVPESDTTDARFAKLQAFIDRQIKGESPPLQVRAHINL